MSWIAHIKHVFIILLLALTSLSYSQKAELMIVKHRELSETNLQLLNENFSLLYDEAQIPFKDTLVLRINYDTRFFLNIINYEGNTDDSPLLSLHINKVPVIIIHSDIDPGDHSWPFYSGVDKPKLRIVGGNTVSIRDYPWQVFVRAGDYICGGTIIADKWVLTAAHCLFDDENKRIPDDDIRFLAGVERPFDGIIDGESYDVRFSVVHEDYNPANFENDLALLRTNEVIQGENARPLNIITAEDVNAGATDPGRMAIITGWGLIDVEPPEFPDNLQFLEVPVVSKSVAQSVWGPLPDNMLMAGYPNDRGDACSGDSGGPLIVKVGTEYKIAGVTSWGSSKCNSVGGYVRLSEFLEWLSRNTGIGQNQFRTIRPAGSSFRCQNSDGGPTIRTYTSDTITGATSYEWIIEPPGAGTLIADENMAMVAWSSDFAGEAYVSARALTDNGYTNYAGQRVVTGMNTRINSVSPDTSVCYNSSLSISVNADGSDLSYNWYRNNTLLLSESESAIFINELQESEEGAYQIEVVGSCGSELSEEIFVTGIPLTEIQSYPDDQVVDNGSDFSIDVIVTGDNLNYSWSKDGEPFENEGNSVYFSEIDANATGLYSVRIDGTCGSKVTPQIYVYVDSRIEEFPDGINIWPTLTRDRINIAIDSDAIFDVYIYNSSGIFLGRQEKRRYKTQVNLGYYAPDVYFVEVRLQRESKIYKVVRVN